jgi:hypothetical protein
MTAPDMRKAQTDSALHYLFFDTRTNVDGKLNESDPFATAAV